MYWTFPANYDPISPGFDSDELETLANSNWIYFYDALKFRSFHHTPSEVTAIMKYEQKRQPSND